MMRYDYANEKHPSDMLFISCFGSSGVRSFVHYVNNNKGGGFND